MKRFLGPKIHLVVAFATAAVLHRTAVASPERIREMVASGGRLIALDWNHAIWFRGVHDATWSRSPISNARALFPDSAPHLIIDLNDAVSQLSDDFTVSKRWTIDRAHSLQFASGDHPRPVVVSSDKRSYQLQEDGSVLPGPAMPKSRSSFSRETPAVVLSEERGFVCYRKNISEAQEDYPHCVSLDGRLEFPIRFGFGGGVRPFKCGDFLVYEYRGALIARTFAGVLVARTPVGRDLLDASCAGSTVVRLGATSLRGHDVKSLTTLWRSPLSVSDARGPPLGIAADEQTAYVAFRSDTVASFDVRTGARLARRN